ncbi:MAG: glycosyltransferase [Bacteroidales bacterium]|nr:glycosyltransferase [Bacteroidales bacterium]
MHTVVGGDTIQVLKTTQELNRLGVNAQVFKAGENIDYEKFDLLHFFNLIRPADHLYHIRKSNKPYVFSTIYLDYSGFDKFGRSKSHRILFGMMNASVSEYVKNIFRFYKGQDKMVSSEYLLGHKRAVKKLLSEASAILPNSVSELNRIKHDFDYTGESMVVPNGIDINLFRQIPENVNREQKVICMAQVFGMKNQHTLIEACNKLNLPLEIIGNPPPNHAGYYNFCKKIAGKNVTFHGFLPQEKLIRIYASSKVHALPSWFETTGLSSLEAGALGCNLVVSPNGDTEDYFKNNAWFCLPNDQQSINKAVEDAVNSPSNMRFRDIILEKYTWTRAAEVTKEAYQKVLDTPKPKSV